MSSPASANISPIWTKHSTHISPVGCWMRRMSEANAPQNRQRQRCCAEVLMGGLIIPRPTICRVQVLSAHRRPPGVVSLLSDDLDSDGVHWIGTEQLRQILHRA